MINISSSYLFQIAFKMTTNSLLYIAKPIYIAIDDIVESYKYYAMLDINIRLFKHEDPRMLLKINSKLIPK